MKKRVNGQHHQSETGWTRTIRVNYAELANQPLDQQKKKRLRSEVHRAQAYQTYEKKNKIPWKLIKERGNLLYNSSKHFLISKKKKLGKESPKE